MIEKVIEIAREAGELLKHYFEEGFEITDKEACDWDPSGMDIVTTGDIEAEKLIVKRLNQEFPGDKILCEEESSSTDNFDGRVWMIDPIDGTRSFAMKGRDWAVMIGLCIDAVPVLGVIYLPMTDMIYYAEKGKGAFCVKDGKTERIKCTEIENFSEAKAAKPDPYVYPEWLEKMITSLNLKSYEIHGDGGIGWKGPLIASGKIEMYFFTGGCKWDFCAPQVIIEEAGGKLTYYDGRPVDYAQKSTSMKGPLFASNGKLHKKIIEWYKAAVD
ncbi:inositol monophosphatase family protein [Nanoarchaeota archaeon]